MKTFHILVFGCQMNYADSARIKAVLTNCGFSYTENEKEADILIFDTCSVRQKSEDKITGKLKEISKKQKVRITGCMIQHNLRNNKISTTKTAENIKKGNFLGSIESKNPEVVGLTNEEIKEFSSSASSGAKSKDQIFINHAFNPTFHRFISKSPNVELFFRIDDTGLLPIILEKLGYKIKYDKEILNEYSSIIPEGFNTSMNNHSKTAYVPISTGCNQFCSYCIVPYARGLEKHFPLEQILQEVKNHLEHGAQEIVLIGQIVNKHPQFVEICKAILELPGLERLRYTSPYPNYYSSELLELHESNPKMCPHIHMPLQSGSDSILKKMFRGYTVEQAKTFIKNIQNLKRNISITTDIIVGFPGETDEDFEQTLDLVRYGKFDMIYIGIYSPRPGTHAARNLKDDIDRKTKRERRDKLNNLLKEISGENNQKEIGKSKIAIIDQIVDNEILGYTDNMKQIIISPSKKNHIPGEFVNVKITKSAPFKIYGEIEEN